MFHATDLLFLSMEDKQIYWHPTCKARKLQLISMCLDIDVMNIYSGLIIHIAIE